MTSDAHGTISRVRLTTLGDVRCYLDEREVADLPNQRLRCALLVYLAVERDAKRETVQNIFWSDRDDEKGKAALKQTIYELRRVLGEDWIASQGDRLKIASHVTVDLADFVSAAEAKDWRSSFTLFQGAFLQGFSLPNCKPFEFWSDRQRVHAARLHRVARREHIAELVEARDASATLAVARRWAELEPLEDEAQHKLIELLAASGERAEALRQADNYERLLAADGLQPLDETRKLVERLRAGDAIALANSTLATAQTVTAPPAVTLDSQLQRHRQTSRSARSYFLGIAALALLGVTLAVFRQRAEPPSVAVLPFRNMTGDSANDYLTEALAEEVIGALVQMGGIRVPARTSSFVVARRNLAIPDIARQLKVNHVVEGSLQRVGNDLRVIAQLVKASDDSHLWSQRYDRVLANDRLLAIEEELAGQIAQALQVRLKPRAASVAVRHKDPEAYNLYAQGRHFWYQRGPESLKKAIEYFQQAIARDSTYALAYTGLADAYLSSRTPSFISSDSALALAKGYAAKAVALDSALSEAWVSTARVRQMKEWNWKGAEEAFARAISLDSENALAYSYRGLLRADVLGVTGQLGAGIRDTGHALELDALNPVFNTYYGSALSAAGLYDESIKWHRRALELSPIPWPGPHWEIADAYRDKGDEDNARGNKVRAKAEYDSALVEYEKSRALSGAASTRELAGIAYVHARTGRRAEALKTLDEIRRRRSNYRWVNLAVVYLGLEQRDSAFAMLDSAIARKDFMTMGPMLGEHIFDPLRSDQRFTGLLEKVGLFAAGRPVSMAR